eukprot:gene9988-18612_t
MGHSAKNGVYSMFSCHLSKVIDFQLVQKNEAGRSNAMELYGFKKCLENLVDNQKLAVETLVTDRHVAVTKYVRENYKEVKHYYDIWNIKKLQRLKKVPKAALTEVHFNANILRAVKLNADGERQINIFYPKFQNGEASIKDVREPQNFDYIEEIYELLTKLEPNELRIAQKTLEDQAPAPINTMLTKQPREEAIIKQAERKAMVTLDVPPTNGEHQSHVKCSVLIISCKISD